MKVAQRGIFSGVSLDHVAALSTRRVYHGAVDRDAMSTRRPRGRAEPEALTSLPTAALESERAALTLPPNHKAWNEALAVLGGGGSPPSAQELRVGLELAEAFGIPRQTAIQDIFDAIVGPNAPAEVTDWLALLLANGDSLDLDALSRLLKTLEILAHPERNGVSTSGARNAADRAREAAGAASGPSTLDALAQAGSALGSSSVTDAEITLDLSTLDIGTAASTSSTDAAGATAISSAEDFVALSGAELAAGTLDFAAARQATSSSDARGMAWEQLVFTYSGAPNETFATAVKADAAAYIASVPGLQAACDRMLAAADAVPAKADRLRVELALYHFETVGAAEGRSFGATQADVVRLLAASEVGLDTRPPTLLDLSQASNRTFGYPVGRSSDVCLHVGGSNNTIDLCTNPYPGPSGTGHALLGGSNNEGQVDLVGTIMVLAGESNTWVVKDPSLRIDPQSELQAYDKDALAANAQTHTIILEGDSADWRVRVDAVNATYTNNATGTSVTIPASAQDQVRYASASEIATVATGLAAGQPSA